MCCVFQNMPFVFSLNFHKYACLCLYLAMCKLIYTYIKTKLPTTVCANVHHSTFQSISKYSPFTILIPSEDIPDKIQYKPMHTAPNTVMHPVQCALVCNAERG